MKNQKLEDFFNKKLSGLKPGFEYLKSRRLLLGYFAFVTLLMIYQHSQGWAWDFSVYSLNGQYLFHEQVYMEWKRPPLLPFILGVFQFIFSMKASEYLFILLNSAFFLFSSLKFSRIYDLNPLYLYVLVMSPYAVFYGALEGTELLFLSFLTLMLAEIHRPRAGAWFGMAFLTRYTGALFVLLILFQKNMKKIVKTLFISGLIVLPWLIFNYIVLGHPFASMADSYALDVVERGLTTPFKPQDLFLMTGLGIPFALLYVKEMDFDLTDALMIFTSLIIVSRQLTTKVKVRRYLYDLSLPVAFLAVKGLNLLENPERIFYIILGVYLIGSGFLIAEPDALTDSRSFEQASEDVGFCKSVSNRWPMLSYAGTPTGPLEAQLRSEEEYLEEGYKIVRFENGTYSVEGDECVRESFNSTYIYRLENIYDETRVCDYVPISTCKIEDRLGGLSQ